MYLMFSCIETCVQFRCGLGDQVSGFAHVSLKIFWKMNVNCDSQSCQQFLGLAAEYSLMRVLCAVPCIFLPDDWHSKNSNVPEP